MNRQWFVSLYLGLWSIIGGLCWKNGFPLINYIVFNVMFKENLRYKLNKLHNPKYKQPNHCLFNEVDLVTINIHLSKIIATDVFLMHQTTWHIHMSIQTNVVRLYESLLWSRIFGILIMKHFDTNFVSFDYSIFTPHRHAHKAQFIHWWPSLKHTSTIEYAAELNLLASRWIHLETTQVST